MEKCIWERMLDKCEKEKTILAERVEELEQQLIKRKVGHKLAHEVLAEQNEKMLAFIKSIDESFDLIKENMPEGVCKGAVGGYFLTLDTKAKALIAEIETK